MQAIYRQQLGWGILLLSFLISMLVGNSLVPVIDRSDFRCSLDGSGEKVIVEQATYGSRPSDPEYWGWIRHFELDLNSNKLKAWSQEQSIRQMLLYSRPPLRKADETSLKNFQYSKLPLQQFSAGGALVADRYLFGPSRTGFLAVDLHDPNRKQIELAAPDPSQMPGSFTAIPGSQNFLISNARSTSPTVIQIDLVSIQEDRLEIIATWKATRGPFDSVAAGDQIASLSLDGKKLEFRDINDGQLVVSLELPDRFDATVSPWYFDFYTFAADLSPEERLRIDLGTKQTLASILGTKEIDFGSYVPSKNSLLNFHDINALKGVLIHKVTGQQVMTYDTPRIPDSYMNPYRDNAVAYGIFGNSAPILLDDHRLFFPKHAYGFSAEIVEIPSGKLLSRVVPLWWVPWFVILVVCGYLLAALGWMQASARKGGWVGLDVALIAIVPHIPLSIRACSGDAFDLYRTPHLLIQGISIAGLTLAGMCMLFGKTAWIIRGLPFLLGLSIVIALRNGVLQERPGRVWDSLVLILAPVGYALLIGFVAKLLGFDLHRPEASKEAASNEADRQTNHVNQQAGGKSFGLREVMLVLAVMAVFFAASRPLLPSVAAIFNKGWYDPSGPLGAIILLVFSAALLSPGQMMFRIAVSMALLTVATILVNEIVLFVYGVELPRPIFQLLTPFGFTLSIAVASITLLLLPARLRGWKISLARLWFIPPIIFQDRESGRRSVSADGPLYDHRSSQ